MEEWKNGFKSLYVDKFMSIVGKKLQYKELRVPNFEER